MWAWVFIGGGTTVLSLLGILLWPVSVVFEGANGHFSHVISQFWARLITVCLPFWEIDVRGLDRIEKGKAKLPFHFKFIAKRGLFWVPFFGWHLALARYISLKKTRGSGNLSRNILGLPKDTGPSFLKF